LLAQLDRINAQVLEAAEIDLDLDRDGVAGDVVSSVFGGAQRRAGRGRAQRIELPVPVQRRRGDDDRTPRACREA